MGCGASAGAQRREALDHAPEERRRLLVEVARPPSRDRSDVGLAETPTGAAAAIYKFFCPLCMLHFREVFETPCCNAYICAFCHADYVRRQDASEPSCAAKDAAIPVGLACPHCASTSTGDPLARRTQEDTARLHVDSPSTKRALQAAASGGRAAAEDQPFSPLRIGDGFAAMARKMSRLEDTGMSFSSGNVSTSFSESSESTVM